MQEDPARLAMLYVVAGFFLIGALVLFFQTIGIFVFFSGILLVIIGFGADIDAFKGIGVIALIASVLMGLYLITVGQTTLAQLSAGFVNNTLYAVMNPPHG